MTAHLSPEVVALIRSSPESVVAIARRFGIARQTVTKIRLGKTHLNDTAKPGLEEREEMVRAVLSQPPNMSLAGIKKLTGIDRDVARRIRLGLQYADLLPELERMTAEESSRRCWDCVQWVPPSGKGREHRYGRCHLGFEEATETQTWARGCGAFMRAP